MSTTKDNCMQLSKNETKNKGREETLSLFDILEHINKAKQALAVVFSESLEIQAYGFIVNKTFEAEQYLTHLERVVRRAAMRQSKPFDKALAREKFEEPQKIDYFI